MNAGFGREPTLASQADLRKCMNKHNDTSEVQISLTDDEALVLFEFLSRLEAEVWVLSNLLGPLQEQLMPPFQQDYVEQLQQARNRLRGNFA
jgi:hypothetical protein